MYGATLGGRILKNKLFNFFGFEIWDKTEPATLYNTVPTERTRADGRLLSNFHRKR
jgi:hypothetical protein